jgi:hypothetical protein
MMKLARLWQVNTTLRVAAEILVFDVDGSARVLCVAGWSRGEDDVDMAQTSWWPELREDCLLYFSVREDLLPLSVNNVLPPSVKKYTPKST